MISLEQRGAGNRVLQVLYVPIRRVNQEAHLHFLFVVGNQSLFVNVAYKTADENPSSDAKITICRRQSVSFHRVPCYFTQSCPQSAHVSWYAVLFFVTIVLSTCDSE